MKLKIIKEDKEWWLKRRPRDKKNLRILLGKAAKGGRHVKKGGPYTKDPPKYKGNKGEPGLGLLEEDFFEVTKEEAEKKAIEALDWLAKKASDPKTIKTAEDALNSLSGKNKKRLISTAAAGTSAAAAGGMGMLIKKLMNLPVWLQLQRLIDLFGGEGGDDEVEIPDSNITSEPVIWNDLTSKLRARFRGNSRKATRKFQNIVTANIETRKVTVKPSWQSNNLVLITLHNGRRVRLNRQVASSFRVAFKKASEVSGYNPSRFGSFNPRFIKGTDTVSLHTYGIAVDINALQNPRGGTSGEIRKFKKFIEIMFLYNWLWAGVWRNPDDMHFEYDVDNL